MSKTVPPSKPPSPVTAAAQAAARAALPADDGQDFEDARRGFIATLDDAAYPNESGRTAWSMAPYAFLDEADSPESVHPGLWRQARLNCIHGLFEVLDGVYQVRGIDLANMTIVEGETGIIVIDALSTREGAAAALALYRAHRGPRPVAGVIVTHTHVDHWGGLLGVAPRADYESGRLPLIAPDGFLEHAVSENVIAGPAMRRRAVYQFGNRLPPGPLGHVDNGLGKAYPLGRPGLVAPNDLIRETGETRRIDGVEIVFQMAPDTEAPAEMHMFFPESGLLNMAENATHTFHNLLPFRGAQARNALNWARYLDEARDLWGADATALVGQHHWPVWGATRIRDYLAIQRDLYKFTHDQTLRLANQGLTPQEIAETLRLPASIDAAWHARGYYGSLRHNAKAIYQHYIGWYDGVPARLDPLPPQALGKRMVAYMGGADAVLEKVAADLAQPESGQKTVRFAVEALNHLVFAEPENAAARALLADCYEQLGYMAECATWRNSYLTATQELRDGPPRGRGGSLIPLETMAALSSEQALDMLATQLDPGAAEGRRLCFLIRFTDREELVRVTLENCALTARVLTARVLTARSAGGETATAPMLELTRPDFDRLALRQADAGEIACEGSAALGMLTDLLSMLATPAPNFPIVEP